MTIDKIQQTLEFPFPPERVWRAITIPEELTRWFSDKATIEPVPGGAITLEWEGHPVSEGLVEIFEPHHTFAFRWRANDVSPSGELTPENSTLVTFSLTPTAAGSRLEVTETGFAALPPHLRSKVYQENDGGWNYELGELVDYLK